MLEVDCPHEEIHFVIISAAGHIHGFQLFRANKSAARSASRYQYKRPSE